MQSLRVKMVDWLTDWLSVMQHSALQNIQPLLIQKKNKLCETDAKALSPFSVRPDGNRQQLQDQHSGQHLWHICLKESSNTIFCTLHLQRRLNHKTVNVVWTWAQCVLHQWPPFHSSSFLPFFSSPVPCLPSSWSLCCRFFKPCSLFCLPF